MGLLVDIFKHGGTDCSRNGISSRAKMLCIVNVDGPFQPSDEVFPAMLVPGNLPGCVKIVPCVRHLANGEYIEKEGGMFGGSFAYTSDSRFHNKVREITGSRHTGAIAIHDRFEW